MSKLTTMHGKIFSYGFARFGYDDPLSFQMAFEIASMGIHPQTARFVYGQCHNGAYSTAPARIVHALMENLGVSRFSEIRDRQVYLKVNEAGEVCEVQNPDALASVNFAEQVQLSRSDSARLSALPPMTGKNGTQLLWQYAVVEDVDFFLDPMFQFALQARLENGNLVSSGAFDLSTVHRRGRNTEHAPGTAVARLIDNFLAVAGVNCWEDFNNRQTPVAIRVGLENGAIRYIGHFQDNYWCDLKLQATLCTDETKVLYSEAA